MHVRPFVLLVLVAACREAPPEAPTDLGELSTFLFDEIDNEDTAAAALGASNLRDFLLAFEAGTTADQDAAVSLEADGAREDRTWSLPILEPAATGGSPLPATADTSRQLPAGVAVRSAYGAQRHVDLIALNDQVPVEPESSAAYDREFTSDLDCFLDGSCARLSALDTVHRSNLLIDVWYDQQHEWLAVDMDEGRAVLARTWIDLEAQEEGGGATIEQWSSLVVHLEDGAETLRFTAVWGSSSLNDTLQHDFLINQVCDGVEEGYEDTEAYLAAE